MKVTVVMRQSPLAWGCLDIGIINVHCPAPACTVYKMDLSGESEGAKTIAIRPREASPQTLMPGPGHNAGLQTRLATWGQA